MARPAAAGGPGRWGKPPPLAPPGARRPLAAAAESLAGRQSRLRAVHQWQGNGSWRARPDLTAAALLPEVPAAGRRFAWLEGVQRWGDGAAWIAAIGPAPGHRATLQAFVATDLAATDTGLVLPRSELVLANPKATMGDVLGTSQGLGQLQTISGWWQALEGGGQQPGPRAGQRGDDLP